MVTRVNSRTVAAPLARVRGDGRRSGQVGLDARWRGRVLDDLLNNPDGLVRLGLPEAADQVDLDENGLPIGTLGGSGRERVAPEVPDELHMFGFSSS